MAEIDPKQIEANRVARNAAVDIWDLIEKELERQNDRSREVFWTRLEPFLRAARPDIFATEPEPMPPMSDVEARRFENESMPFGQHQDGQIKNVPLDYLNWLAAQDDFRGKLNRYLRSKHVQREQELEGD